MANGNVAIFSLLDTPAFGGAEQYMFSHLRFLNNHGFTIVLATNNPLVKKEILSRLTEKEKKTFHIILAPYRLDAIGNWKGLIKFFITAPKALVWCYRTLSRLQEDYDKSICLWPGFSDRLLFSPIAKKLNIPLIWIEIGPLEPTFKKTFGFPKLLYAFAQKYPTHLITTSLFTKKSIIANTHFKDKDITLVYPGTKLHTAQELTTFKKKAMQWRKQNHLQKDKLITVVGRIAHENEIDMVVRGFSIFFKKSPAKNIHLQIIGDGPQRNELESLVKKLQMQKNIHFRGFVTEEEKQTFLAATDIFIFPRAWELDGFGMTTIEALSQGIPVLTTDFGPQKEIVTDGLEGFRYVPHDSKDLSLHIAEVLNIPNKKILEMSKASSIRAKVFSETKSQNRMLKVINTYI